MINHARKKQKNLVTTLFDFTTTFGEVDHELITYVLKFHHVPDQIVQFVMQDDSLSPLLLNLVVNTLIITIKDTLKAFNDFKNK